MRHYIGIDIAKHTFDADIAGNIFHLSNNHGGWTRLIKALKPDDVAVMEATGGYEQGCAGALRSAGIPVAIVNPADAAAFRKGLGFQAKTDAIDAAMLSRFGEARKLEGSDVQGDPQLAELVTRRHQLVAARSTEKQRTEHAGDDARQSIGRMIAWLEEEIVRIEAAIEERIMGCDELSAKRKIMLSAPGIGKTTAALLLALLPELGTAAPRKITSLVGLVPHPRQSGRWQGRRRIGRGRVAVRRGLFMAVMGGVRGENALREIVANLKACGKAPKQAIIACARKLLVVLNAMLRDATPYHEAMLGRCAAS